MKDLFFNPITWGVLGMALMVSELLVPGVYLLFFGIAAALMALVFVLAPGIPLWTATLTFFALIGLTILAGHRLYRNANSERRSDVSASALNDRADIMTGQIGTIMETTHAQGGQVRLGDTSWRAQWSGALAVGDSVVVERVVSTTIHVRKMD